MLELIKFTMIKKKNIIYHMWILLIFFSFSRPIEINGNLQIKKNLIASKNLEISDWMMFARGVVHSCYRGARLARSWLNPRIILDSLGRVWGMFLHTFTEKISITWGGGSFVKRRISTYSTFHELYSKAISIKNMFRLIVRID